VNRSRLSIPSRSAISAITAKGEADKKNLIPLSFSSAHMLRGSIARPKAQIDPELVEKLASQGLSAEQIAAVLGVGHRTLERRFAPS
jgi:hypothetical protein